MLSCLKAPEQTTTFYLYTLNIQSTLRPVDVNFANEEGYTALHYACWRGHQKIAKKLLEAEADVSARYVSHGGAVLINHLI